MSKTAYTDADRLNAVYMFLVSIYMTNKYATELAETSSHNVKDYFRRKAKNALGDLKKFRSKTTHNENDVWENGEEAMLIRVETIGAFSALMAEVPSTDEAMDFMFDELEKLKFRIQNKYKYDRNSVE